MSDWIIVFSLPFLIAAILGVGYEVLKILLKKG